MVSNVSTGTNRILIRSQSLWTMNAVPRRRVYGESLKHIRGKEYRRWDPHRSKIAAGLLRTTRRPEDLLPKEGASVLYLGAGHGTTISHIHDIVCGKGNTSQGRIIGVDISPRCIRDLLTLSRLRPGFLPVLGDARKKKWTTYLHRKVDWLFQDVSQSGQIDIFLDVCRQHLDDDGIGIFSFKMASERWTHEETVKRVSGIEMRINESGLNLLETIDLHGFEDQHHLFIVSPKVE